jgi:diguanylate cyclase (GGDEF)-like protein
VSRLLPGSDQGLRSFASLAGLAVVATVIFLTADEELGVAAVRAPLRAFAAMRPNTAVAVGALGLTLALSRFGRPVRRLSLLGALLAATLGAATVVEYAGGWDLGIDRLLLREASAPGTVFPGRPALLTAVLLFLLGVSPLLPARSPWSHWRTGCVLVSLLITWTLLNGFLFARAGPPDSLRLGSVAVQAAATLCLLALGTLASRPRVWPVRTVFADSIDGTICRWLLPAALFAPPLLGWLLADPASLSQSHAALRWALYSVSSTAGSTAMILVLAHRIGLVDAERNAATIMSRSDALTGLANRRAFDLFLLEAFNLASRHGRALALLTIDIDHFKSYNDSYGHPAGDEVLQGVAKTFISVARDSDLVARIGGEEFAIVLPQADAPGAYALADRIRVQVSELKLRRQVTVSIGVATLSSAVPTVTALLEESDAAMYAAKRRGRNQVVLGGPPESAADRVKRSADPGLSE